MRRLVYTSTARRLMNERDLQAILRIARTNNAMNQITGLLIYHEGCFFQAIEGDAEIIDTCYHLIKRDQRHENCILLSDDTVVSRLFSNWWMSFRSVEDLGHYQKKQFLDLQDLAEQARGQDLTQDIKTNALLLAFLSGFRDLEMIA